MNYTYIKPIGLDPSIAISSVLTDCTLPRTKSTKLKASEVYATLTGGHARRLQYYISDKFLKQKNYLPSNLRPYWDDNFVPGEQLPHQDDKRSISGTGSVR